MRILGRVRGWVAVLLVSFLVAACGDSNEPGDTSLTIENESGITIAIVNFSDCDDPEWGDDQLDSDEFIEDGESRSWGVNDGCYDIRVIYVGGTSETLLDQQIDDGEDFIWTVD